MIWWSARTPPGPEGTPTRHPLPTSAEGTAVRGRWLNQCAQCCKPNNFTNQG